MNIPIEACYELLIKVLDDTKQQSEALVNILQTIELLAIESPTLLFVNVSFSQVSRFASSALNRWKYLLFFSYERKHFGRLLRSNTLNKSFSTTGPEKYLPSHEELNKIMD